MKTKRLLWISTAMMALTLGSYAATKLDTDTMLKAPNGYYLPVTEGKGKDENSRYTCEMPPTPYTGPLQFTSKYEGSDSSRDELSADAESRYQEATSDITHLEKSSVQLAEDYLQGKPGIASRHCLISWLETWAQAGALLSDDHNHTGKSVRKWALGTVASSYFLVKAPENAPEIEAKKRKTIEDWLAQVAQKVVIDWSNRPESKRNNHDYWAAWSVMITSVVLNRQDLFDWANNGLSEGLAQVDSEGFLPNELKRSTRALSYHNYAIQPLVMLSAFSEANHNELKTSERLALIKLVTLTVKSLANPAPFEQKTGEAQVTDGLLTSYALSWMEPYVKYFPESELFSPYFEALRPMKTTRLGGNLTRIFNTSVSALAAPPAYTEVK
ncbi:mannuronate-specific alginate lyase [Alkalimarinus alittae]|uniref:Mannuronate-specific alginate lyase n=1 Tax=Alkalimarinus alittae TaxID=2961619 RepID=A0ABY6N2S8_9ALTE|nr:mannuronate-specific alginate lyase [Alkalimarinus alittae]UZE96304.1 mannuronate-specific alginate lyase [Alkalimarinus alittae]